MAYGAGRGPSGSGLRRLVGSDCHYPMLEQELARLIAERDVITARIYEIRRELSLDRRGRGVVQVGEFSGLPFRAAVYVRRAGFRTREQLEELFQREGRAGIVRLRRIGPGTAYEIERWLKNRGNCAPADLIATSQ
jgi:hypothetical protein